MRHIFLSASLLALSSAPTVWAQTNTDDEVISVGSRISGSSFDTTTSAATILTEADIQARGQALLSDILRSLPGLAVSRSGPSGNFTQIRVRGSEANQVLVLIDGVEAGNPNTGEFDFAGIRSEDIVKIEVLRGEQSAIWGSDAIGGVINIITRAGSTHQSTQGSVEVGTDNTFEAQLSTVIPLGTAALSLNGNIFTTDGFDITGPGLEDDDSESESVSVGLNNVELGPLTLSGLYSASELRSNFDNDGDFDGIPENTDNLLTTNTQRANITGLFEAGFTKNKIGLSLTETNTLSETGIIGSTPSSANDTQGRRLQANWATEASFNENHNFTILGEVEDESFETFAGEGAGQNQDESITNFAIAGDYKYTQGPVNLTGSIRQDFNDRFDNATTWRVGASYKIEAINGRVYGSYGTGVKNPTFTEIFGFFPGSFLGNPDIQPERSEGFNIGYRQDIFDGAGFVSFDYFQSDLEDEIATVFPFGAPTTVINNTGDSTREGLEVEAAWSPITQLDLGGALTFLDAENPDGSTETRRPDFTARANVTWRPVDQLSITGTVDYTGDQADDDFSTFPSAVELDSFTLIGANISYDFNDVFSVYVRGENLADEEFQEVFFFDGPGRQIFGGIRASF